MTPNAGITRLVRFGLTTPYAERLFRFYQRAFGFRRLWAERHSGSDFERLLGVRSGARSVAAGLGDAVVELLQFDQPGRPYPDGASASDLCFQHLAIVVSDMKPAYERLRSTDGWSAISTDGPRHLSQSLGGVTAFKFRDPDGHPLELLAFPRKKVPPHWHARFGSDPFLGIDHSAISVSDTQRSVAFYEALGLHVAGRSLNSGIEQEQLDGIRRPQVEVTALQAEEPTPHLELLCYRSIARRSAIALRGNDVAATRLVFEAVPPSLAIPNSQQALIDPDGHHLMIVSSVNDDVPLRCPASIEANPPSEFVKLESPR